MSSIPTGSFDFFHHAETVTGAVYGSLLKIESLCVAFRLNKYSHTFKFYFLTVLMPRFNHLTPHGTRTVVGTQAGDTAKHSF